MLSPTRSSVLGKGAGGSPSRLGPLTGQLQEASPFCSQGSGGLRLHPLSHWHPTPSQHSNQEHKARLTVGLVGTRTLTGTQARPPAAAGGACSLPWKLDGGSEKAEVGQMGVQPQQHEGMQAQALLSLQPAPGPSSLSPQAPELPSPHKGK